MKALVVANWKMNPATVRDAKRLFEETRKAADAVKQISVVVAPPIVFLRSLSDAYKGKRIAFAAQHIHPAQNGAYTGEIAASQARDARATYAIIGHSEQRARGFSNDDAGAAIMRALDAKLIPILCVGETKRSPSGEHFMFIREQLKVALKDVPPQKIQQVVIAYEPVWAIGGEKAVSPRDMQEMNIFIHKALVETHGEKAFPVRVLYGGSVNEESARPMIEEGTASGLLIGHVSIEPERFALLLESLS